MKIDAHQHFWQYDPERYGWISEEMRRIRRDFMPEDLQPVLAANGMDGAVLVQVHQTEAENDFFLSLAARHSFVKGIVGWADFQADDIDERLDYWSSFSVFKGFRHIVQAEADEDFLLRKNFRRGIEALSKTRFAYDILVVHRQLPAVIKFAQQHPNQRFVLDHLGKPDIRGGLLEPWATHIRALGQFENVFCKISGMVTEADWGDWSAETFKPYLDTVTEAFGTERLMFGSDWPVCLVAGEYEQVKSLADNYFAAFSSKEKAAIFGGNAVGFYQL
ncbi:MAG: amidohydrolase family protein [Saprospiraceae bacterium]|nr:amidohydrolase family protein [Saprospiraceae bacterium]